MIKKKPIYALNEYDLYPLLIYEIEGEDLLPNINKINKSYGYEEVVFEDESFCGYYYKHKINCTKEEYEFNSIKKDLDQLEEQFKIISSKEYFDKTQKVVKEYDDLFEKRIKYQNSKRRNERLMLREINKKFFDICQKYNINNNMLDIRFHPFMYDEIFDEPKENGAVAVTHFFDRKIDISFEEYIDFIKFSYEKQIEKIKRYLKEGSDIMILQFNETKNKIKELLKIYPKVGLFNGFFDAPINLLNKDFKKIDEFTIDDFLQAHPKTIYWFKN